MMNEFTKVIAITINGSDRNPEGLIDFAGPDKDAPYWLFTFKNGRSITATGNVEVIYEVKPEAKTE